MISTLDMKIPKSVSDLMELAAQNDASAINLLDMMDEDKSFNPTPAQLGVMYAHNALDAAAEKLADAKQALEQARKALHKERAA